MQHLGARSRSGRKYGDVTPLGVAVRCPDESVRHSRFYIQFRLFKCGEGVKGVVQYVCTVGGRGRRGGNGSASGRERRGYILASVPPF